MRYDIREWLDIIIPQSEDGHTIALAKKEFLNAYFNVFLLSNRIIPPLTKYSQEKLCKLQSLEKELLVARNGMRRIGHGRGFGTCACLLPDAIVTTAHVACDAVCFVFEGELGEAKLLKKNKQVPIEMEVLFTGANLTGRQEALETNLIFQFYDRYPDLFYSSRDPILNEIGDFDCMDACILRMDRNLFSQTVDDDHTVLFVPSPELLQVDSPIMTLHYPGVENQPFSYSANYKTANYYDWAPTDEDVTKIFHGFGKLCVSTGTVLAPYHKRTDDLGNSIWKPNTDHQATFENSSFILSNESLVKGSSGGIVLSPNYKIVQLGKYKLVEFCGIHFGGEFIKCKSCLEQKLKFKPECRFFTTCQQWNFCEKCKGGEKPKSFVYNYAVSVLHPLFKTVYCNEILPELLKVLEENIDHEHLCNLKKYANL